MHSHEVKITHNPLRTQPSLAREITLASLEPEPGERKSDTPDSKEGTTGEETHHSRFSSESKSMSKNNNTSSRSVVEGEIEMTEDKNIRSSNYQRIGKIKLIPPPPTQKQHSGFLRLERENDESERGKRDREREGEDESSEKGEGEKGGEGDGDSERGGGEEGEKGMFPPLTPSSPPAGRKSVLNFANLLRQLKTQDLYGVESARKRLRFRAKHLRTLDHVQSLITILQCFVIVLTCALAAVAAEMAWIEGDSVEFVPTDWTSFLQSLIMLCSIASLVIFYIETRIEVIMKYPNQKWMWPWYFPSFLGAFFEMLLYGLHCPPMVFEIPLIVCTSLRFIFVFRLCKFHPDVRSIRFNQIMTGECPSFSTFFFYKTIVRTSPMVAIIVMALITTPLLLFLYLQTSRMDAGFAANPQSPAEVLWTIVWFVIAQQSPDALPTARVSAILAAIVSIALSTMIFTGLLGSLEMDSAQSTQYEIVYRKQVLEDVRNLAAKTIQTAFRYSRSRNSKAKKLMKRTQRAFRSKLTVHLELREKDRGGGSVIHSISHLISTTEDLAQRLDRLKTVVEGKHAALYNLDTNLHSQTIANLAKHFEGMLAKQDEASTRYERVQNGSAATLSSLQRDLHDVAVQNMRSLESRQEQFQRTSSAELHEQLAKLTAAISQITSRQDQDRQFMQQQFEQLKLELQGSQSAGLHDAVLKLRGAQHKRSEELHAAVQQSTQIILQQLSQNFSSTLTANRPPALVTNFLPPLSPARSSSIPPPPPTPSPRAPH